MNIKIVDQNLVGQPGLSRYISPKFKFKTDIENPDVVVFTDQKCFTEEVDTYDCKKVAWIIEPPIINGNNHINITDPAFYKKFDYVYSYNRWIEERIDNFVFLAHGGTWLREEDISLWDKEKSCSMIYSNKNWNAGHNQRLRVVDHLIGNFLENNIDFFGTGSSNPIDYKIEALKTYRFSIAMENEAPPFLFAPNTDYFSEKLLDCFLTGTFPIYYGNPTIKNYFNEKGMIVFNDVDNILDIYDSLSNQLYEDSLEAIKENFEIAKKYIHPEDTIYNHLNVQ